MTNERRAMGKWSYEYADDIPEADRYALEAIKQIIAEVFSGKSLFWHRLLDSRGRSHYRLVTPGGEPEALCQFVIEDIVYLEDHQLKNRLIAGDFPERAIP
jgi:hypothetical protein